jgi:hypothetical protein
MARQNKTHRTSCRAHHQDAVQVLQLTQIADVEHPPIPPHSFPPPPQILPQELPSYETPSASQIDPVLLPASAYMPPTSTPLASQNPGTGTTQHRNLAMPLHPAWSKQYHAAQAMKEAAVDTKVMRQQIDETRKKLCDVVLYYLVSLCLQRLVSSSELTREHVERGSAHHS